MITLDNVSKSFRAGSQPPLLAVKQVSIQVEQGEFVSFVGPSGCGKTTLLNMIAGVIPPDSGNILINGKNMNGKIYNNLAYLFQKDTVLPWQKVRDNLMTILKIKRQDKADADGIIKQMLTIGGLTGFENHYPSQLSGGMRRRLALLQVIVAKPEIILLDEPFSALDEPTRLKLHTQLAEFIEGKTAVLVTHDIAEAISLSDRVVVLTRRPAQIKSVHNVNLTRPRNMLLVRETREFLEMYQMIWKELREEIMLEVEQQ